MKFTLSKGTANQYIAGIAGSLSIMVSSSSYGWITPLLTSLLTPQGAVPMTAAQAPWVVSILELASIVSPLPAGILINYVGRKPVVLAAAPIYVVGWLAILFYRSVAVLMVARCVQGVAMGLACTVAPVYLGEIASDSTRGAISSLLFNAWWLGFLVQFTAGPLLNFTEYTIFTMLLNVPFFLLFFWQPETPHYYVMAGDIPKAERSLGHFRDCSEWQIKEEVQVIQSAVASRRSAKISDILGTTGDRKAFTVLMVVSVVRIFSGAGAILVWATRIFAAIPNLFLEASVVTVVLGVVMFAGGIFGSLSSDTLGRRPLLLVSSVGAFVCQTVVCIYFYLLFETSITVSTYSWVAPALICLYSVLCSAGMYPVAAAYTSELFAANTRGMASCMANLTAAVCSFLAMFIFPLLTNSLGMYSNFALYSLVSLCGSVYFYFEAPETKGKSFGQIRSDILGQ